MKIKGLRDNMITPEDTELAELTNRERVLFPILDTFANALDLFMKAYPVPEISISSEASGHELLINPQFNNDSRKEYLAQIDSLSISDDQRTILDMLMEHLQNRYDDIIKIRSEHPDNELLEIAWRHLKSTHESVSTRGVTLVHTPLSIVIVLRTKEAMDTWLRRQADLSESIDEINNNVRGIFIPQYTEVHEYAEIKTDVWKDAFIFIRANPQHTGSLTDTLRHEYLHSIYHYLISQKGFTDFIRQALPEDTKLYNIQDRLRELEDKLEKTRLEAQRYGANSALSDTLTMLDKIQGKIRDLESQLEAYIESSDNLYNTEEAYALYEELQNELVAYTYGSGEFVINKDALVPFGDSYEERLSEIKNESDRKKIGTALNRLLAQLQFAKDEDISPKPIGLIILTSSTLMQAVKRITIYLRKHAQST